MVALRGRLPAIPQSLPTFATASADRQVDNDDYVQFFSFGLLLRRLNDCCHSATRRASHCR